MADSKDVELIQNETANNKAMFQTIDTTWGKPTLQMSIYDFIEYLTKEKEIYIDIKQFKRQLEKLKGKNILTLGELLSHDKDFLFHDLHFNMDMLDEVSRVSIALTGQDIGELSTQRTDKNLAPCSAEGQNFDEAMVRFERKDAMYKKYGIIALGSILGLGLLVGIIAIIIAVQPESMEAKLIKMFDSIPQAPEFGSSFWDWQVNLNKWGELEDNEKGRVYYILTKPDESENDYAKYVYKYPEGMTFELADQLKIKIGEEEGNYYGQVVNKVPHGMGRYVNRIGQIWEG